MHIGEPAHDFGLSSQTRLPAAARRLSQKVLLVLLTGRMWVADGDRRRDITGPTWVVWYPGEPLEYGADGPTVHWLIADPTGPVPSGSPRPGSRVRLRDVGDDGRTSDEALLVHYLDDSPDGSGPLSVVADVPGGGIGIYALTDVLDVVDEADEDLNGWDFGPGADHPVRRRDC